MITAIEEFSLNAWPSFHTMLYDGWVIRFANGYTKRSNSVNPLYASTIDFDEKLTFCEDLYRKQKLNVVFKITPAVFPGNLDDILSARGYRKDSPTSVQILELEGSSVKLANEANLHENLSDEWMNSFCRMSTFGEPHREILRRILQRLNCWLGSLKSSSSAGNANL